MFSVVPVRRFVDGGGPITNDALDVTIQGPPPPTQVILKLVH